LLIRKDFQSAGDSNGRPHYPAFASTSLVIINGGYREGGRRAQTQPRNDHEPELVSRPRYYPDVVLRVQIAGVAIVVSCSNNTNTENAAISGVQLLVDLIAFVVSIGYFVYFWGRGQTLAMRLFPLRVVDATTGAPIGYGRAALRSLGGVASRRAVTVSAGEAQAGAWRSRPNQ